MQLPGQFAPPYGRVLLALTDTLVAGTASLRSLGGSMGEVRRLYVRPQTRRGGVGRALMTTLIDEAFSIDYHELRLETLDGMRDAHALYHSLGFVETARYRPTTSEHDITLCMTMRLNAEQQVTRA